MKGSKKTKHLIQTYASDIIYLRHHLQCAWERVSATIEIMTDCVKSQSFHNPLHPCCTISRTAAVAEEALAANSANIKLGLCMCRICCGIIQDRTIFA